jgi:hypothetical protein
MISIKLNLRCFFSGIFLPIFLQALIVQTNQMSEVLSHVDFNTWVFFDIDDTLITSQMQLGRSDYYFVQFTKLRQQGMEEEQAHEICRAHWNEVQEKCPIRLMDPLIPGIVSQIQQMAAYTLGLTARGPQTNLITQRQLRSLNLDFTTSSPSTVSAELPYWHLYENGVWFVESNGKGHAVRKWFAGLSEHPTKVVFVDDRLHHLENMEAQLSDLSIEYVGVHYIKTLEHLFDSKIAEIQAKYFPQILSDEEAEKKL